MEKSGPDGAPSPTQQKSAGEEVGGSPLSASFLWLTGQQHTYELCVWYFFAVLDPQKCENSAKFLKFSSAHMRIIWL